MADELKLYETDDTTVLPAVAFLFGGLAVPTPAGSVSDVVATHLWNSKGSGAGTVRRGIKLRAFGEITPGVWAESGDALMNKQELQVRVTGSANPGNDPLFVSRATTGWVSLGKGAYLDLSDMRPNCAIYLELRYAPGIAGGSGDVVTNWRIDAVNDQWSVPFVSADIGILCRGADEFVVACFAVESGTPDDVVNLSHDWFVGGGVSRRTDASTGTLNQNDSAAAALTAGQAYEAIVSRPLAGGAAIFTKGLKATAGSTVTPALPPASLPIAHVNVSYQGGGTSVITNADITQLAVDGRGAITFSGASFDVSLAAVRALTGTAAIDRPAGTVTGLTPSVTTRIYLADDGSWSTTGGLPFYDVTTDGSGVTGAVLLAPYVGGHRVALKVAGNETAANAQDWATATERGSIDRLTISLRVASSGGATGSTTVDVNLNGTSIFGTPPTIAAGSKASLDCWPTTTVLAAGDALTIDTDATTTGGTKAIDLEAVAWVY